MFTIAVEGCSHAGKTTLISQISRRIPEIISLPDYVAFAGGDDRVPPAPSKTVSEELAALEFFLDLDSRRLKSVQSNARDGKAIIEDRSFHTLLAHRFAIEQITRLRVFEKSCLIVQANNSICRPELILYLDTPQAGLNQRYKTRISSVPV